METESRADLFASSASVKNGSPFIRVWVPSSLMRRISVSMLRSSVSCISSATTVCPMLGISSQNSSRVLCGWYPVKNMRSGPIRKMHLLSTTPTPPWAYATEVSRTAASSHAANPRMIPEGVTPFIEPDVRENHERADEQENISNRPALAGEDRKPRPRLHEAAHADDDIHR